MSTRKNIKRRLTITFAIFAFFSFLVVGQIIKLQFVEHDKWTEKLKKYKKTDIEIPADRGNILDCNGLLLASTIPSYKMHMDMRADGLTNKLFYDNIDSLSYYLSKTIKDKTKKQYKAELKRAYQKGSRFHTVSRRKLTYTQYKATLEFPLFKLGQNTSGYVAKKAEERKKPFGLLASRTIGTFDTETGLGRVGIEESFDQYLKGSTGIQTKKRVSGAWVNVNQKDPIPGKSIKTTIDIYIQDIVETALLEQMKEYRPKFGTAIVMDVKTGDIKAMANLGSTASGQYAEKYNYAIGSLAEPGSTFKLPSLMVALEDGVISLEDTVDTKNGKIKYFKSSLSDSKKGGYGKITAQEVFEKSSNIGISQIIYNNYKDTPEKFINRLYAMGINEPLNIGIKGERPPFIKFPSNSSWSGISLPWMSIGYEVSLLPLHTLTFYNAVANNGKMVRPRLVTDIMHKGKSVEHFKTEIINPSICSNKTIKQAQTLLAGVVENGTAKNLNKTYLKIAGKTGTARVALDGKGYGNHHKYRASFCGYFPAEDPMYSCIVLVESPSQKGIYGNVVAGTVFREIADKIYAQNYDLQKDQIEENEKSDYMVPVTLDGNREELIEVFSQLNTPIEDREQSEEWVKTFNKNDHIEIKNQRLHDKIMPNVCGMGAKDAIFILENKGLKVNIKGVGRVTYQSIQSGHNIREGMGVNLELKEL